MSELFSNPSRPFYNSVRLLKIGRIDRERYQAFIQMKFTKAKKVIDPSVINDMLGWTDCLTYYVQMLCNRVFVSQGKYISETASMGLAEGYCPGRHGVSSHLKRLSYRQLPWQSGNCAPLTECPP